MCAYTNTIVTVHFLSPQNWNPLKFCTWLKDTLIAGVSVNYQKVAEHFSIKPSVFTMNITESCLQS